MKKILLKLFFPLVLILISAFLCFKNYSPGTYLIGWDSLHPEFNFPEAFRRAVEGVWRAEQGVGALAAHSHMADLPRIVFLWLESFIIPASFLRYSYIFLCLILGPLGVYFFLKYVFQKEKENRWTGAAAFLGAMFYLLNLSTLQNFYVPFEMFTAAFAFIPWVALLGLKFLREGGKRNLLLWAVLLIISSPMAYAATLWYASFSGFFIFLATITLISPGRKLKIKRFLLLLATAVFLNLYWILPNTYSIIDQSALISNSNINRLFSSEAFLRNRDYGNPADILLQKSFLFSWRNFETNGNQFTDLLGVWTKYLENPIVLKIGYILAGFYVLGILVSIIRREKVGLAMIPAALFAVFFLININPPTGGFYAYLYNNFGVFAEGFRMPFTKFSILYQFLASFYFGFFILTLLSLKESRFKVVRLLSFSVKTLFFFSVSAGLIYFMLPAFNGWMIGPNVRKAFPAEYGQVFNWFNSKPYGQIALFPINSKYGWEYRNWAMPAGRQGYEGSGFLTYGLKSPILYRDFDRWSIGNEDFYNQSAFALYANDSESFVTILKKYNVKYLLLDESIINPGGTAEILKIPELKNIFAESGFREVANFGFLTVYESGFGGTEVYAPSNFIQSDTITSYLPVDPVYAKNGDYINTNEMLPVRISPEMPQGSPVVSEDLSINRGFPEAFNCDLRKNGTVFKTNSSEGILYRAEGGGASCDYLGYLDLKYNQGYVLRVAGENREGRSIKMYLFNQYSEVPDVEEILPSGSFDKTFPVYPKNVEGAGPARNASSIADAGGYVLNLETRSFGRLPSENLLTKVEFYPVDPTSVQEKTPYIYNNLKILGVTKYGTWAYKIVASGDVLLTLGRSYDPGWIAIPTTKHKLQHVEVNSWANGWIVPSNQPFNQSTIYLIFWPQLLEWGGGIIGLITFLGLILRRGGRQKQNLLT